MNFYRCLAIGLLAITAASAEAQLVVIPIPSQPLPTCPPASPAQTQRALAEAKRNLPKFWQTYREAWVKSGRFMVLGSYLRRDGSYVNLWADVTAIDGFNFQGKLRTSDTVDPAFRKGDTTGGLMSSVIDWGVKSQITGRWYGFFWRRASLPNCSPAQRADLMARLLTNDVLP